MTKFILKTLTIIVLSLSYNAIHAQQTPLFADYYYNQALINPAHSGYHPSTELSVSNSGYLSSFEGSPRTFSGILNTSVFRDKVGISGGFISDQIGVTSATTIYASYAYKIFLDHNYNRARWWNYNQLCLLLVLVLFIITINFISGFLYKICLPIALPLTEI